MMSFSTMCALVLAGVLLYGVGYGVGVNDGKGQSISAFKKYGQFEHNGTHVTAGEIKIVPPAPLAPAMPAVKPSQAHGSIE